MLSSRNCAAKLTANKPIRLESEVDKSRIVLVIGLTAVVAAMVWLLSPAVVEVNPRLPIPENDPANIVIADDAAENPGTLIRGSGTRAAVLGTWPQFRGPLRNGIAVDPDLPEKWSETGPRLAWKMTVGEGHAGAVIAGGCLYLVDYDEEAKEDVVRCLSLADGAEVWRYTYSSKIKRNHGMSRTVPAASGEFLVTLGPRCQVHCLHATTGELHWKKDLVREYGTRIPEWYAGQCPLIDGGRVILAPGGKCLMTALDLATGATIWETPNEQGWDMTHASITPVEAGGERQYVWCASGGALGVSAETGDLLWTYPGWTIKIANIPSPVDLGEGRILLSGGYNAGAEILQIQKNETGYAIERLAKTEAAVFGSDQHTPLLLDGFIYGVIPGGKLACLDRDGQQRWIDEENNFGLGPYLALNGRLLVLDDNPKKPGGLSLFRIASTGFEKVAHWPLDVGHEAWAPMAYAGGRLVLRDSTTLMCLHLAGANPS